MSANVITTTGAGAVAEKLVFNASQIDLIKTQIARECTDAELALFIGVCERTGLDPFSRQIYAIRRPDKKAPGGARMVIQTGIDGYRLIADRTGRYAGNSDAVYQYDDHGRVMRATVTVGKLVQGVCCSFTASALMSEYRPSFPGPLWDRMPHVMLAKCAEAAALRKAFPADLSGLYTQEEMEQAEITTAKSASTTVPEAHLEGFPAPDTASGAAPEEMVSEAQLALMNHLLRVMEYSTAEKKKWGEAIKSRYGIHSPKQLTRLQAAEVVASLESASAEYQPEEENAHV